LNFFGAFLINYGPLFAWLSASLYSSSSMVSEMFLPRVSGKHTVNNPQQNIANPKTPNDQNFFSRPFTTRTGARTPPNTNACRIKASAEFLTQVGNNSMLYIMTMLKHVQALKNDTTSITICTFSGIISLFRTQHKLQMPLNAVSVRSELRLLILPTRKNVTREDGNSARALNVTLRYRFDPRLPTFNGMP
jgi:hypothetical protein